MTTLASDGSLSDTSLLMGQANDGDTILLPPGNFTWGTSGASLNINRAVTVKGAGTTATTITLADTGPTAGSGTIKLGYAGCVFRGCKIVGSDVAAVTAFASTATQWRITDVHYISGTQASYFLYMQTGTDYGLIDSSIIDAGTAGGEIIFGRGATDSWDNAHTMGTVSNVIIEDCVFPGEGYVSDFNANCHAVVRFCSITGQSKVDGHGFASNTPSNSCRNLEVYFNDFSGPTTAFSALEHRGGTGMVLFNTNVTNGGGGLGRLRLIEYAAISAYTNTATVYGQPAPYYVTPTQYPSKDLVGRGRYATPGSWATATSEPVYIAGNRQDGALWGLTWNSVGAGAITQYGSSFTMQDLIAADRDYFIENASFDGTSGVGIGTKAQMEAITPTTVGVGYWVTDESSWNRTVTQGRSGQLYVWNGSSWALYYTPYQYPHPWRGVEATPRKLLNYHLPRQNRRV